MSDHTPDSARARDEGYTIIEVIVSIGIFTLFIAMMLTTIVAISQSATRTQLVGESTNGAITVFGALDRQARYSDSINYPGTNYGKRWVEFRTPAESTKDRITMCTQWMYDPAAAVLKSRTWNDTAGSAVKPWVVRLTNVINDGPGPGSTYPFTLVPAGDNGSSLQQLVVALHAGNKARNEGAQFTSSFVARNSSIKSPSNVDNNNDKSSDTPVCTRSGSLPRS